MVKSSKSVARIMRDGEALYLQHKKNDPAPGLTAMAEMLGSELPELLADDLTAHEDLESIARHLASTGFMRAVDNSGELLDFFTYDGTATWTTLNPIRTDQPTTTHLHDCFCCGVVIAGEINLIKRHYESDRNHYLELREHHGPSSIFVVDAYQFHRIETTSHGWYASLFDARLAELTILNAARTALRKPSWSGIHRSATIMPDHSVQGSALSEAWVQTFDDSLDRANNDRGEWKTDSGRRLKLPPLLKAPIFLDHHTHYM